MTKENEELKKKNKEMELIKGKLDEVPEIEPLQNEDPGEKSKPQPTIDDYDQSKDYDFSDVKIGGRHIVIKAPESETESGILLDESTRKQIQSVQDTPAFQKRFAVVAKGKECKLVEIGDMVLLSPHVANSTLEIDLDGTLYLMMHEDFVLMAKPQGDK